MVATLTEIRSEAIIESQRESKAGSESEGEQVTKSF